MKRRQNHSCEQCRRSKKACDGHTVNDVQRHYAQVFATMADGRKVTPQEIQPCTYCVRTKKQCSLNPHWGQCDPQSAVPSPPDDAMASIWSGSHTKRRRTDWPDQESLNLDATNPLHFLHAPSISAYDPFTWDDRAAIFEKQQLLETRDSLEMSSTSQEDGGSQTERQAFTYETPYLFSDLHAANLDDFTESLNDSTPQYDAPVNCTNIWGPSPALTKTVDSTNDGGSAQETSSPKRKRAYRASSPSFQSDISSALVSRSNNYIITEGLLRIYHDVLENNLACWITEETCPYQMRRRSVARPESNLIIGTTRVKSSGTQPQQEWGSAWSNRMYRRVQQLDRVAQSNGLIRLTAAQNRAASKALDLAIMAFATQWSQGTRRRGSYPSTPMGSVEIDPLQSMANTLNDGFELHLQQCVWEQAKMALEAVSGLECYRAVYAELVFGLTSRPWADDDFESPDEYNLAGLSLSEVTDMLYHEVPPPCLQRAVRKIHTMRFNLDSKDIGLGPKRRGSSNEAADESDQTMTTEERGTIGLLFWLAVMLDTVSSSMNERPVTLSDEEVQHDEAAARSTESWVIDSRNHVNARWDLDLYAQEDSAQPSVVQWPCSYEAAARAVARSAAVKVLFFRYVSYLQNALRKRQSAETIESIIDDATTVYRYWNRTHGAFIRALIKDYDAVPPRLKSWFPCIAIPWHLAALMLADIITFIDENELGDRDAGLKRTRAKMAQRIRRASALDLSDIAKVTTPSSDGMPAEQLADFHFAVNEGPLLMEPWSDLLIRAFAKAALFYLAEADEQQRHEWSALGQDDDLQDSLSRGENCVRALWFLGRKSDTARNVTRVLARGLSERRKDHAAVTTPSLVGPI